MELYIKVENGQPKDHPILLENLQNIYSNFLENYESLGYMPCEHLHRPGSVDPYAMFDPIYNIQGNVVVTSYIVRKATSEERAQKIADRLNDPKPFASWILNEDTLQFEAPVNKPNDGGNYVWDEETTNWILVTE